MFGAGSCFLDLFLLDFWKRQIPSLNSISYPQRSKMTQLTWGPEPHLGQLTLCIAIDWVSLCSLQKLEGIAILA